MHKSLVLMLEGNSLFFCHYYYPLKTKILGGIRHYRCHDNIISSIKVNCTNDQ